MQNINLPILIAKDKDAKIFKNYYKIGWLMMQGNEWTWIVWGNARNLDGAKKCARLTIRKNGKRQIYLSENPLSRKIKEQRDKLQLIDITEKIEEEKK